jgi:hypothetical protein
VIFFGHNGDVDDLDDDDDDKRFHIRLNDFLLVYDFIAVYVTSADNSQFKRRIYRIADKIVQNSLLINNNNNNNNNNNSGGGGSSSKMNDDGIEIIYRYIIHYRYICQDTESRKYNACTLNHLEPYVKQYFDVVIQPYVHQHHYYEQLKANNNCINNNNNNNYNNNHMYNNNYINNYDTTTTTSSVISAATTSSSTTNTSTATANLAMHRSLYHNEAVEGVAGLLNTTGRNNDVTDKYFDCDDEVIR